MGLYLTKADVEDDFTLFTKDRCPVRGEEGKKTPEERSPVEDHSFVYSPEVRPPRFNTQRYGNTTSYTVVWIIRREGRPLVLWS